jgi:hypothetical protein
MIATFAHFPWRRARRFGIALLLLALPACGLSDYEALMKEAQEREERFREEQKYLDEPLTMPTERDKEGKEVQVANVFLRPPKGIRSKPEPQPRNNLMWQYPARSQGGDFASVEVAFATDDKDFVKNVVDSYQASEQAPASERDATLPFDNSEFNDGQYGYSVNVSRNGQLRVAIVYVFPKARRTSARKTIDLSLRSLVVNPQQVSEARRKYKQKSPWRLKKEGAM